MASEPGERTIAIHILPNTSRSKDNRAIKFGQLIEYEKHFSRNHTQNVVEKIFQGPFLKNQKLSMSLDQ